jgi:hypothetical protein
MDVHSIVGDLLPDLVSWAVGGAMGLLRGHLAGLWAERAIGCEAGHADRGRRARRRHFSWRCPWNG